MYSASNIAIGASHTGNAGFEGLLGVGDTFAHFGDGWGNTNIQTMMKGGSVSSWIAKTDMGTSVGKVTFDSNASSSELNGANRVNLSVNGVNGASLQAGGLFAVYGASGTQLFIDDTRGGVGGAFCDITFRKGGSSRWIFRGANGAAESGGNAGSDYELRRRNDDGSDTEQFSQ